MFCQVSDEEACRSLRVIEAEPRDPDTPVPEGLKCLRPKTCAGDCGAKLRSRGPRGAPVVRLKL